MKTNNLVHCFCMMLLLTSCYNQRENITYATFTEPENPEVVEPTQWEATGRGLHLSFASKDAKYKKGNVPMKAVTKESAVTAWRGERVSLQAVLWSSFDVKQVECEWSDLVSEDGDTIASDFIDTHFVRYIMSDDSFVDAKSDERSGRDSCLVPDMLDDLPCIDMKARTVRPLWFTVDVPLVAKSGSYLASLKVYSKKNPPQELRVRVNVVDQKLPEPKHWRFQTNMGINPIVVANWHNIELWSEAHFNKVKNYLDLMILAGQKNINAFVFNQESNEKNSGLIKWKKSNKGIIEGDFTNFDKWIKTMLDSGIDDQIDCIAYQPSGINTITFLDDSGNEIVQNINAYTDANLLKQCYKQLINHLKEGDLFDRTVFVIGAGDTDKVTFLKELVLSVDSDVKLEMVAQEWSTGLMHNVYAANVPAQFSNLKEWFKLRHQQGLETSYQIEPDDIYPNLCLQSPSAEATWLGWYAASQGIDGIHVERFNDWGENPLVEARLANANSGSHFLIYPDARSSIRYERLIEGIQDFEKILILKEQLAANEGEKDQQQLELIDEILSDFVIDRIPRESAEQMLSNGQALLNQIVEN